MKKKNRRSTCSRALRIREFSHFPHALSLHSTQRWLTIMLHWHCTTVTYYLYGPHCGTSISEIPPPAVCCPSSAERKILKTAKRKSHIKQYIAIVSIHIALLLYVLLLWLSYFRIGHQMPSMA